MSMFWVIVLIQAVVSGALASTLASKKGHDAGTWFAAGLFLGILGLIAAAGLPDSYARAVGFERGPQLATVRHCPDCAEPIRPEAIVCRWCGHRFEPDELIADAVGHLERGDEAARADAVRVLSRFARPSVVPHLTGALRQCDWDTCAVAVDALRSQGASSAVPELMILLRRATSSPSTARDAQRLIDSIVQALTELADASVGKQLLALLDSEGSVKLKVQVVQLAGAVGAAEMIPALLDAADRNEILRPHVWEAVELMGAAALPILRQELATARRGRKKRIEGILEDISAGHHAPRDDAQREPD